MNSIEKTKAIFIFLLFVILDISFYASAEIPRINSDVDTEFGVYAPYLSDVVPNVSRYTIDAQLANVSNTTDFRLSEQQRASLAQRGFIAVPSAFDQIHHLYQSLEERGMPIFVTTDSVLHAYHILYDYTLRILEFDKFSADLRELTFAVMDYTLEQYRNAKGEEAQKAALKNLAYFTVASEVGQMGATILPEVKEIVDAELALIDAHQGIAPSPIFGYQEDYSQYIPRGHYTRNETFMRFFKAMMWYGRMMFRLKDEGETLQAILITAILEKGELIDLWDRIYQPTVFFVGKADDLTARQYMDIARQVYGEDYVFLSADELADSTKVTDFIEAAKSLPSPLINSAIVNETEDFSSTTKGFRFMGQRFIPDSYILFQLSHKRVQGRFLPKGLDVFAVLGSERAHKILMDIYGEGDNYPDYEEQLEKIKAEFAQTKESDWVQNLYWSWLYSLLPLLTEKGEGYPTFMQNDTWQDKELMTALGSWTELRHDTILYAKQSYTEVTSIPPMPEFLKGYVEPNPELYARLASLARMMYDGLEARGLLVPEFAFKLKELENLLISLKEISEAELTHQPRTEEQYRLILNIGDTLESLTTFSSQISGKIENEEDQKMAIVADVHTDPNSGRVLEEGVGKPMELYVIVPDDGEMLKICSGAMFSYYEFPHPMADRLTDGKWQKMIDDNPPDLPIWAKSFVVTELNIDPNLKNPWDVNQDGIVNIVDVVAVAIHFGEVVAEGANYDVNRDGKIDIIDLVHIGKHFGEVYIAAAPDRVGEKVSVGGEISNRKKQ